MYQKINRVHDCYTQQYSQHKETMTAVISSHMLLAFYFLATVGVGAELHGAAVQNYTIYCDPIEISCRNESLEDIADSLDQQADVKIDISTSQLQLTTNLTFAQLSSLSISGNPNLTTINCTGNNTGLMLVNITNLTLRNLMLTHCGAHATSRSKRTYSSALTLYQGRNVEISDLVITRSRGLGLSILSHQGGTVLVKSTTFKENELPEMYKNDYFPAERVRGGGGVYIGAFQQQDPNSHMLFHFSECTFVNNIAYTRFYDFLYTDDYGKVWKGHGRGGGAYLSLRNGLSNVHVLFSKCKFMENEAFLGGGLSVKISGGNDQQTTTNISVEISDSLFDCNGCNQTGRVTGFGGGAHVSFDTFNRSKTTHSRYILRNVTFTGNCAQVGGGVFYFSNRQKLNNDTNSVLFDSCTFKENRAHMGSAVSMTPNIFLRLSTGHTTTPSFKNCWFLENTVFVNHLQSQEIQRTAGVGTIYVSLYDIRFEGCNCFENNWGSAVYVVNGVVDLTNSSAHFINNTGLNGGGIALIGVSLITVGANEYRFINNKAYYKGGAIYALMIDNNDYTTSRSCFIQNIDSVPFFGTWSSDFTFTGNKAKDSTAGHSIFATTLNPCRVINNGTENAPHYTVIDIKKVFSVRGIVFEDDTDSQPQVATEGSYLCSNSTTRQIIPGEQYSHNVTVMDDLDQLVNVSLRAMVSEKTTGVELNPAFSSIIGDKIELLGEPHKKTNVTLQTVSLRQAYITFEVELLECPPGFKLKESVCICNADAYVALFKCNRQKFHSHLIPGFWAGLISDRSNPKRMELATSICPFCDYSTGESDASGIILPRDISELTNHVCGTTRRGILCGSCQTNYTVHFHSPDFLCKPVDRALCKVGWLFYILSELVPVTAVFITVLALNISFTSGTVNGFILFSQLIDSLDIDASGIITMTFPGKVKRTITAPTQGYQVIYGFFNLDFFNSESLSFCLWNGASALDMLAIKYVTVLYALLLIVVVVCIINKCGGNCLGKCCRITTVKSSVTHGISTFLMICYAQCVRVSLSLLISVDLYVEAESKLRPETRVWYDGNMIYLSREHLLYAVPAIFCLLIVGLVPPALLLIYPLLNKLLDILGFEDDSTIHAITQKLPVSTLKPLLDSFQGCFKDNLRFFAGLYFLYRWTILLVYMNTTSFSTFYMAVGGIFVLILALHAISQPYIKRTHNIIDAILLTNLVLINGLSFLNYYRTRVKEQRNKRGSTVTPARVQLALIYLPFVIMSVYTLVVFYKHLRKKGCKNQTTTTFFVPERARKLREFVKSINTLDEDTDQDDDDEELPHRLLAGDIDYACFEDSD